MTDPLPTIDEIVAEVKAGYPSETKGETHPLRYSPNALHTALDRLAERIKPVVERLERERDKLGATVMRQLEALETKGLADAYRDGFAAALDTVKSLRVHVTAGTPEKGIDLANSGWIEPGQAMIVSTLEDNLAALTPADRAEPCPQCGGSGKMLHMWDRPGGPPGNGWGPCPTCQGTGKVADHG